MKKVLIVALSALALAGPAWAQEVPDVVPPVPPEPPAQLAQAAPSAPAPRPAPAPPAAPSARPAQAAPAPPPAPTRPAQPRTAPPARVPAPAAVPAPPAAPESPRVPRNVRFDITITDSAGGKPVTKSLSVTVSDANGNGSIRNSGTIPGSGNFPLNVDVRNVSWYSDTVVRASVNVEYQPYVPDAKPQPNLVTATANAVFQDGRKMQILQAADSTSDRRTTIEVTATILK
jgi:hypothetical protein